LGSTDNYKNQQASICNTVFIFENMSDSKPKTDIVCGSSSQNWSYYRKIPASLTESKTGIPSFQLSRWTKQFTDSISAVSSQTAIVGSNVGQKGGSGGGSSKAWIAGAVIGPILGLVLVGAGVWLCLRRRKNKRTVAQQGGAAMVTTDPSHPPAGVGGYTDAKPQFTQQHQPAFVPDPYANQGAFAAQQGYADAPVSPATQYNSGAAPYNAPVSPPPQQDYYGNDVKHGYTGAPLGGASELGGGETSGAVPATHNAPIHQAAELGGDSRQGGAGLFGTSELPASAPNHKPAA
jgi:hypothetical protein